MNIVKNADRYRSRVDRARRLGVNPAVVPQGESYTTFVNRQIKYLGSAKTGFNEPEEKGFFNARQANLRAGLKKFQSLRKQILFGDAG